MRMAWVRVFAVSRLESHARAELELVNNIAAGTGQLQSVQLTQHSLRVTFYQIWSGLSAECPLVTV